MIILYFFVFLIVWGMAIGWIAQLFLGRGKSAKDRNWLQAIIAGAAGSFVAGSLGSLILGEGFQFKAGGIIGSVAGAIVIVAIWNALSERKTA